MVISIVLTSALMLPMTVLGEENGLDDNLSFNQIDSGIFEGFRKGFGGIFGNHLGYGGRILGTVFQMLFLQGMNLTSHEMLDNVFVLSANVSRRIPLGTYNFANESDDSEVLFAPFEYNLRMRNFTGENLNESGIAYCVVEKHGEYTYEIEVGTAVTLVVWDNDKSFITAVNKMINFFKRIMTYQFQRRQIPESLIKDGIALLTWFLIHINDIFTGDELFVLNPISWQKLVITPQPGFEINKTWYLTGPDMDLDPLNDPRVPTNVLNNWKDIAQFRNDTYMEWLLDSSPVVLERKTWTQFSFDLIQLWIKNFEIHIDVAQILDAAVGTGGGNPDALIANAFNGCNIDFYLFTHHLAGAYLYNDTDSNDIISANYRPTLVDDSLVNVPSSTELTHRLMFGTVEEFQFQKPIINPSNRSISWGINLQNVNISTVPLGVRLQSYSDPAEENLEYVYFGFTFEPKIDKDLSAAHGLVKLDQFFAPWNDPDDPYANSPIKGLDLAIIYVSTVLHFELDITTQGEVPEAPTALLDRQHYKNQSHKLMVGNYIGRGASEELNFVDIAGPDYEYGNEISTLTAPASTSIIPLLVWEMEMGIHDTYTVAGGEEVSTFSTDIGISTEFNVMVYAVCYPEFNEGTGIWHDPTFSVYMVFESEEFWAIVVLIAGISLVGVATILIKRRKDGRI
jgi:hypothetical protein